MELSGEARRQAVEAFREEFAASLLSIRKNLSEDVNSWRGTELKMLLHKLRGGAGFLGYVHLTTKMLELEKEALTYPSSPVKWYEVLNAWESEINTLT